MYLKNGKKPWNSAKELWRRASELPRYFIVFIISLYQWFVSPFLSPCCRFYPSCSEYSKLSFKKYGVWRGLIRTMLRLAKCHPWHPGGYDPVK